MYRVSIYKIKKCLAVQAGSLVKDYKYTKSNYMFERILSTAIIKGSLSYKKDKNRKFFRQFFDGELFVSGSDYDFIENIRTSAYNERCKPRYILIEDFMDGRYVEFWRGFIKIENAVYENCTATFNKFDVFDRYSEILTKMGDEHDVVTNVPTDNVTVLFPDIYYDYDEKSVSIDVEIPLGILPKDCDTSVISSVASLGDGWTLFYAELNIFYPSSTSLPRYRGTGIYRRDKQCATDQPSVDWIDSGEECYTGSGIIKWVRPYLGQTYPDYTSSAQNIGGYSVCIFSLNSIYGQANQNERGRLFTSVIEEMLTNIATLSSSGDKLKSNFFISSTNPVTGETLNTFKFLVLYQKSDLKATTNQATKGLLKISDLENWFMYVFNCYWHIDDNNRFVVEHLSYFDNGYSYTSDNSVGLNLIGSDYVKNKNSISYDNSEIPRYEKFVAMDTQDEPFNGVPIEYNSHCVTDDEGSITEEYRLDNLTLDLRYIAQNENDVSNDGFSLIATERVIGTVFAVKVKETLYTSDSLPNGDMAFPNLQYSFFRHGRFLPSGYMNNIKYDFFTHKRRMIQDSITVRLCDKSTFDPIKLVRTDIGDGEVIDAKYNLKTKELTLNLKYNG